MEEEAGPDPLTGSEALIQETPQEHAAFPPFDATTFASQLLWLAITFVALYYVMAKVALPRITAILESRRGRIASDLDQAERFKADSAAAAEGYEKALAEARAKASAIAESARAAAKSKAQAHQQEVEASLAEKLAASEARITEIKDRALADVGTIAGEAAQAVIERLVDVAATPAEVSEAVSLALAEKNANA